MTSDLPASSSSQQPFASPQPAPVPTAAQPTSPPTKQSLKSWWKTFRPPNKNQEQHGNSPLQRSRYHLLLSFLRRQSAEQTNSAGSLTLHRRKSVRLLFVEGQMDESAPPTEYQPDSEVSVATFTSIPIQRRQRSFSLFGSASDLNATQGHLPKRTHSDTFPGTPKDPSEGSHLRAQRSRSVMIRRPRPPSLKRSKFGGRCGGVHFTNFGNESSDALDAGILADPRWWPRPNFLSSLKSLASSYGSSKSITKENTAESPTGIFGVPLRQSITYANVAISLVDGDGKSYIYGYVPIVVAKCGVYLKEKATNVEGIFRLSGSEKRIKELRTIFDSPDRYGKGLDWAGYTVHDAANVLRRYLNQLPEPIVPLHLYDRFRDPLRGHTMQAVGDTEGPQLPDNFDIGKAIVTYQQLITELPPLNRQLLLYILDLLAVFASKSDENRMTSQNLAAIFQPGMLSHPQHDMAPAEYRLSQDVLIFLIENQDHFLIGMRGTAADEQTVQEVQNGGTPPPGTPNTPGNKKNQVTRSASNASAGADSVRKFGGVRRNVSTSSRHSRQSNGAPSPASPAYGAALTNTTSGGVHRSNTVPSKRSPGLPSNRLQKSSGSPSPTANAFVSNQPIAPRGLSPAAPSANRSVSPSSPGIAPIVVGISSLAPGAQAASAITSQERLLGDDVATPTRERNISNLFQRSPTSESEKKPPNKLRKKRIPESSNPSAQSSTQSLNAHISSSASPALNAARMGHDVGEHTQLESIPSANPALTNSEPTPPLTETPRAEQSSHFPSMHEEPHQSSDKTLKPITSPASSLHSRSSFNDQSDLDHHDDSAITPEQKEEKRSRWRLSRRRDDSQTLGSNLVSKRGLGSDSGAGASTSSVGSSARPRKSFTGDTVPASSDSTLIGTHLQSSNDSGSTPSGSGEEKKGPFGWIKNKMREKQDEKREREAEKERTKSPPASTDRLASGLSARGKSIDVKREEHPERVVDDPTPTQTQYPAPTQTQPPPR